MKKVAKVCVVKWDSEVRLGDWKELAREFRIGESEFGSRIFHLNATTVECVVSKFLCLIYFNIHLSPNPDMLKPHKSGCAVQSMVSENQCQCGLKVIFHKRFVFASAIAWGPSNLRPFKIKCSG